MHIAKTSRKHHLVGAFVDGGGRNSIQSPRERNRAPPGVPIPVRAHGGKGHGRTGDRWAGTGAGRVRTIRRRITTTSTAHGASSWARSSTTGTSRPRRLRSRKPTAALTQLMLDRARITAGRPRARYRMRHRRQSCDLAATLGARVLGITTSAGGVQAATALAADRHLSNARFEQRNGTKNGLPDASLRRDLDPGVLPPDARPHGPARRMRPGPRPGRTAACSATSFAGATSPSARSGTGETTSASSAPPSATRTWNRSSRTRRRSRHSG